MTNISNSKSILLFVTLVASALAWVPSAIADDAAKATSAQKKLKHSLVNLAAIVEQSMPDLEPGFELLKRDVASGAIVEPPMSTVPNAKVFAHKLNEIINELASKTLDTDRLEPLLADLPAAEISLSTNPQAARSVNLADNLRAKLDDRMSRIRDLLHFEPQVLAHLATIDGDIFSPTTRILRQLVLCVAEQGTCHSKVVQDKEQTEPVASVISESHPLPLPAPPSDAGDIFEGPIQKADFERLIPAQPMISNKEDVGEQEHDNEQLYKEKPAESSKNNRDNEQKRYQYVYNGRGAIGNVVPFGSNRSGRFLRQ